MYFQRLEVPARVDHQPAPGEARLIVDRHYRRAESSRGDRHELQKCLKPMHGAQRIRRRKQRMRRCNLQAV